jgi:hypothetical protein
MYQPNSKGTKVMALCPPTNKPEADLVFTPDSLAAAIVAHYKPSGRILEPCRGGGAFTRAMPESTWCELTEGKDFLQHKGEYDWIVTNPPWSKIMEFLMHSIRLKAPNIVFLVNWNALTTKARLRAIYDNGYYIGEVVAVPTPKCFPQMGFQLVAIHLLKGANQPIKFSFAEWK